MTDCLDYRQPTPYLVDSTDYDDTYPTPVLTAGKTFVLGYTNEIDGVFDDDLPVIIFDDFTTASKYVDFPFKAKSSAMKILIAKPGSQIKFVYEAMQRIDFQVGDHKRHWISLYSKLQIPVPSSSDEQQKIADCLSSIDKLITAQAEKIEALKAHKKGLMQKLFPAEGETTPELRFPEFLQCDSWRRKPIGENIDFLSGYPFKSIQISKDSTGIPLLRGINITEGFIRHGKDIDRYYLGAINEYKKYLTEENDLVIGMDGSKVGKNSALISKRDSGSLLIQRVARLRASRFETIQFIFQHIHSSLFHSYVDRINTSGGIPHISASQIKTFEVAFPPSQSEIKKIADCLTSIDKLITAQAEKIEALKDHKKGLMQKLFPSIEEVNG